MTPLLLLLSTAGGGVAGYAATSRTDTAPIAKMALGAGLVAGLVFSPVAALALAGGAFAGAYVQQREQQQRLEKEAAERRALEARMAAQQAQPGQGGLKPGIAKLVTAPLMFIPGVGPVAAAVTSAALSRGSAPARG